jgi:hypothetical protein
VGCLHKIWANAPCTDWSADALIAGGKHPGGAAPPLDPLTPALVRRAPFMYSSTYQSGARLRSHLSAVPLTSSKGLPKVIKVNCQLVSRLVAALPVLCDTFPDDSFKLGRGVTVESDR